MVLDSKQMEWASREGLETATLKKAKVPIYGKWYFPDLPANEPLVNLSTGEIETFPAGYRAGAVLYVKQADLERAGLGPYKAAAAPAPAAEPEPAAEPVTAATATTTAPPAPAAAPPPKPAPAPAAAATHAAAPAATLAPAAQAAPAVAHHAPAAVHHAPAVHGTGEHAHPGSRTYIMVALILAIITAIEVWVYYIPALLSFIFPILIVLSIIKFVMVVGWFMHLKFDHTSYTWYFGGGLALAISLALALIALQIATHGLPPGDGNARVIPAYLNSAPATAPHPAGH